MGILGAITLASVGSLATIGAIDYIHGKQAERRAYIAKMSSEFNPENPQIALFEQAWKACPEGYTEPQ